MANMLGVAATVVSETIEMVSVLVVAVAVVTSSNHDQPGSSAGDEGNRMNYIPSSVDVSVTTWEVTVVVVTVDTSANR